MVEKTSSCDAKATVPRSVFFEVKLLPVAGTAFRWLMELSEQAAQDEKESGKEDWWRPYSGELEFKPTYRSDRVASFLGEWWQDTGGAHPNSGFLAENIDPTTGNPIAWADLFPAVKEGAAMPAAVLRFVHDDLMRQKRQRIGADFDPSMAEDFMKDLGKAAPTFTFAAAKRSKQAADSKQAATKQAVPASAAISEAGGLTLHFGPYDVGAYAEGPYTVEVPAAVLADQLAPAWRDTFVMSAAKP